MDLGVLVLGVVSSMTDLSSFSRHAVGAPAFVLHVALQLVLSPLLFRGPFWDGRCPGRLRPGVVHLALDLHLRVEWLHGMLPGVAVILKVKHAPHHLSKVVLSPHAWSSWSVGASTGAAAPCGRAFTFTQ